MVNKKGWLRIVEATLTVLLVISIMFFVAQRNEPVIKEQSLSEKEKEILEEISRNTDYRQGILDDTPANSQIEGEINEFVKQRIPGAVEHPAGQNCQTDSCPFVFLFRIC